MKLTQSRAFIIMVTLLAMVGAYFIGVGGIDVARAVVESRCSAGAFIAHAKAPSAQVADGHADDTITLRNASSQTAGTYASVPTSGANLLTNGSLETRSGTRPAGWESNTYGQNTSRFSSVAGNQSRYGVRAEVSAYTDGTAAWFGKNIAVTPSAYYQFQHDYRASVPTRAVVMFKDTAGKQQFINLDTVPATEQWQSYVQRFFVPANVREIMVYHPIDHTGWIETDNYVLVRAVSPGFSAGLVTITFDDGWKSIHETALPILDSYGLVSTQYLVSGFLGQDKQYMNPGDVYDFTRSGHEIGSHSFDHADLSTQDDQELIKQIETSQAGLAKCYGAVTSFAAPYGANSPRSLELTSNKYQTARSTGAGFNAPDTLNPYQLKVQNVRRDTSPAQVQAWLDTARANRLWLILVYHQVNAAPGEFAREPGAFEEDLRQIVRSGLDVVTMHDAYQKIQNEAIKTGVDK